MRWSPMADCPTPAQWAALRTKRPSNRDTLVTTPILADGAETSLSMAIDDAGNLLLLVPVSRGPTTQKIPDLNGLKVRYRRLETGDFLVVTAHPSHERVFTPFCREFVEAILVDYREPWAAVAATIRAWQSAWKPSRQQMDKTTQVGLFGELFVLETLMIPCLGSAAVEQWSGPDSERHDFVGDQLHIEVKTTRKSRHEHEISRLDQLTAPSGCQLLMISVQLEETIGGRETIATRVDSIIEAMRKDAASLDLFLAKMVSMGWSEEMRDSGELLRFNLREVSAYEVDDEFPRFPDNLALPTGIVAIRYTIDLANLPTLDSNELKTIVGAANPSYA
ncbi:PD-(D/E)XK motif protein [Dongia rigui]|uniref:PD-(D/E)XK motif protein n=1 Tax=Dongia rigui TaxID=940149 RepID=A0ABU5DZA6_9PROT|nr:PD-(D/E)XK motif protein [Dongia rigui]MDY0872661.1 PD-(D/E)XK motif protein [Dongia rigui]